MRRVHNFNPGPAALPLSVLERARDEFLDYQGTGMSILETSHRSKEFETVLDECKALVKEIACLPDDYEVIFLQGGASLQFAMVPMNLLPPGKKAGYLVTGHWSKKALAEVPRASRGEAVVLASTEKEQFRRIPGPDEYEIPQDLAYVHLTSNNTIYGTQWKYWPDTRSVPLVADMSSDIFSRTFDPRRFALIYAGAQKNLGPAGVTLVVLRRDLLERVPAGLPVMLDYRTHVENNSLYNTPPVFAIYLVKLTMEWLRDHGGLAAIERQNEEKGRLLYGAVDARPDFYRGTTDQASRSLMNMTFRLVRQDLEEKFVAEAKKQGFVGLKGHRSVGGIRVSAYNAVSVDSIRALVSFMNEFAAANG